MMRTMILAALAASALTPAVATAQSYGEVRQDQRDVNQDRRDVRQDVRRDDYQAARADQRDLREDRRDRTEDWRDYRRAHGDVYRRGGYAGPGGYRYRPVSVGYRFAPEHYGRRYWINDPWTYRLARPAAYQRWVRYGNDVVLVDVRSGRVATVYNGFFF